MSSPSEILFWYPNLIGKAEPRSQSRHASPFNPPTQVTHELCWLLSPFASTKTLISSFGATSSALPLMQQMDTLPVSSTSVRTPLAFLSLPLTLIIALFHRLALWRCARYGDGSLRNSMLGRDPFPSLLSLPPHLYATDHS